MGFQSGSFGGNFSVLLLESSLALSEIYLLSSPFSRGIFLLFLLLGLIFLSLSLSHEMVVVREGSLAVEAREVSVGSILVVLRGPLVHLGVGVLLLLVLLSLIFGLHGVLKFFLNHRHGSLLGLVLLPVFAGALVSDGHLRAQTRAAFGLGDAALLQAVMSSLLRITGVALVFV